MLIFAPRDIMPRIRVRADAARHAFYALRAAAASLVFALSRCFCLLFRRAFSYGRAITRYAAFASSPLSIFDSHN